MYSIEKDETFKNYKLVSSILSVIFSADSRRVNVFFPLNLNFRLFIKKRQLKIWSKKKTVPNAFGSINKRKRIGERGRNHMNRNSRHSFLFCHLYLSLDLAFTLFFATAIDVMNQRLFSYFDFEVIRLIKALGRSLAPSLVNFF